MKNRFWEIKAILEKLGMKVSINRNQNEDGTLSNEWIRADKTIEEAAIGVALNLAEKIENLIPERHSVRIDRYASGRTTIQTTYHPDYLEVIDEEAARPSIFHIVPCYIPCPVVSDVDEEVSR